MSRLDGYTSREVRRVAEQLGWEHHRTAGSHYVYRKAGNPLRLSIPMHRDVKVGLLRDFIDIMGITVDEFLRLARK